MFSWTLVSIFSDMATDAGAFVAADLPIERLLNYSKKQYSPKFQNSQLSLHLCNLKIVSLVNSDAHKKRNKKRILLPMKSEEIPGSG
jgi:hypothetical protein